MRGEVKAGAAKWCVGEDLGLCSCKVLVVGSSAMAVVEDIEALCRR